MLAVKLTTTQKDIAEWFIDPMLDYWGRPGPEDDPDDDKYFEESEIAFVDGTTLYFNPDIDIVKDIEYRLLDQYPDLVNGQIGFPMSGGFHTTQWAVAQGAAARRLWMKIKTAVEGEDQCRDA